LIEAKGETSSRRSARYGQPFSRNQCKHHLAVALYTTMRLNKSDEIVPTTRVAIALPKVAPNIEFVAEIRESLDLLGIGVFWVSASRSVDLKSPWRLTIRAGMAKPKRKRR
jgi:hypothetical protein